jgi:hypothetical protein
MLDIDARDLPVLWDADFLHGAKTSDGADTYVLCEINISCVIPYPVDAVAVIAEAARQKSVASPAARLLG